MVRNHIGLEELRIPTVAIVQEFFVEDAEATGEAYGMSNPIVVTTPETFTSQSETQVQQAVDHIIEEIIIALTKSQPKRNESLVQRTTTRGPRERLIQFTGDDYGKCFTETYKRFLDWGWTDGFPVIPPTEEAVREMLTGTKRSPDETVIEQFVPGNSRATVRDIAVNAVMAGCEPEFLPVVITAVEAMHHPAISLRAMTMSTGPHAPLFLVNGPVAKKVGINSGSCSLGNAGPERLSYANAVIGRAVRLILMNVGNCYPGIMDQDTIGSPAKFSMVLAENEEKNPWEPYHVEKGFRSDESTVTCFYGHSLIEVADLDSGRAEPLMNTFALRIIGIGQVIYMPYYPVVLIAPDHAKILARDGWRKNDVRRYLQLHCSISAEKYRKSKSIADKLGRKWIEAADSAAMIPLFEKADSIDIVVAGGVGGKSAAYLGFNPKPYPVKS